jgi:multidrug transporter EmrE-like cation transporter
MPSLLDLPLFLIYSLAGTSAAALGKAAIGRAGQGLWLGGALRAAGACAAFGLNLALLFVLLGRIEMSVMVPIAVGLNLLCASVLSVAVFRERIDGWKAVGMTLIGFGVVLLSAGA